MPSKAEQIAARVAAALTGTTAAGALVYRDRADAFTREESPAILVELVDEDTQAFGGGRASIGDVDRDELNVAVIVVVRNASWQTVADGVRVQAHALLAADAPLRALVAQWRRSRCEWKPASADQPFGYCAQIYSAVSLSSTAALDRGA